MKALPVLLISSVLLSAAAVLGDSVEGDDASSTYPLALPRAMEGDMPVWTAPAQGGAPRMDLLPDVWFSNFIPGYAPQS